MKLNLVLTKLAVATLMTIGAYFIGKSLVHASSDSSPAASHEDTQTKIARAMSAGPADVGTGATIVDTDALGNIIVLRDGTNGFTCMPGRPAIVGDPPKCMDGAAVQWALDFKAHKPKPTNTVPGIMYMLAGGKEFSDPFDPNSKPIIVGPHWMIMWPFDPKTTGLPLDDKPTGAYIMWPGSPYAHLHIMGHP
jgi:hypothetical protein